MVVAKTSAIATKRSGNISNSITFRFSNIVSIFNKSASVKVFCSAADITGLVETRDCEEYTDNKFANLTSFNIFRRARNRHGGGVAIVVKKALKAFRRPDLEHPDLEVLFVDITLANIVVCVFYSPPGGVRDTTVKFIEHIRSLHHHIIQRLVIMGDFNLPDINWEHNTAELSHSRALLNGSSEFSFKQVVNFPTRLRNILDLVFLPVSMPYTSLEAISPPTEKCDHTAIQFRALIKKRNARLVTRQQWKFDDHFNSQFQQELINIDWHFLFAGKSPTEQAKLLESTVISVARKYHRLVSVKQRFGQLNYPAFVTRAIDRRDYAFRKWKGCKDESQKDRLRLRWRLLSRKADLKARQYQQHHVMQAATATRDPKKFWRIVKKAVDVQSVPPLWNIASGVFECDDINKANLLNRWFVSCQQLCDSHCATSERGGGGCLPEPISQSEIYAALKRVVVPGKASGPFLLSTELLLRCGTAVINALICLFNSSLFCSEYPGCWKVSYVTAIPKGSLDKTKCASWRPISLLHPLSKVFESILAGRLRTYLESHSLLSDSQFGFRQKRSTELVATLTVQEWMDNLAQGATVDAVFLDCQKAFDRADHFNIIDSLSRLGISPVVLNLFPDYLRGRQQITVVDGTYSEALGVTSGVPQGSILGPVLFLCLIDNVSSCHSPETSLKIFADDIALSRTVRSSHDETEFQTDLDTVFEWANGAKLNFNPTKSIFVRFSGRQTIPTPPEYRLGAEVIPRESSVKYLGLYLDEKLSWKEHVEKITIKVKKRIHYISFLFSRKCQRARITLYKSLVIPLLDYCGVVNNPRLKGLIDELEGCQRLFLQTINLGDAMEDSSVDRYCNRLHQLGMEPLILRRIKASLILAYKIIFHVVPVGNFLFVEFESVAASNSVAGNTRRIGTIRAHPWPIQLNGSCLNGWKAGAADKSFAFLISRIWNDLSLNAEAFFSLQSFSSALDSLNWQSVSYVRELMGPYVAFFS